MDKETFEIYLNSEVIERDGMAFLSACFSEKDFFYLKEKQKDPETIQVSINHVHISMIEKDFNQGLVIAIQLQDNWMKKLQDKFPNKTKVIQISNINAHEWRLDLFVR